MAKKKRVSTSSLIIIVSLILWLAYFWYVSLLEKQAKIDLANYENSRFCQYSDDCRQIFQAKVLESRTVRAVINLPTKFSPGSNRVRNITCQIRLMLSNSEKFDVTILMNLDLAKYHFDVPNVTLPIPSWDYDDVAAHDFPVGAILHAELWHDKLMFIYSKYINQNSHSVDSTEPFLPPKAELTAPNSLDTTGEYAVPTKDHPLIHYAIAKVNVQGGLDFPILLIVGFVIIRYLDRRYAR